MLYMCFYLLYNYLFIITDVLGVAIELTQVLEEYVRGQRSPNVTETLVLCSKIYPSLFDELNARTQELCLEEAGEKKARKKITPPKHMEDLTNMMVITDALHIDKEQVGR